jgi:hypothetical protein
VTSAEWCRIRPLPPKRHRQNNERRLTMNKLLNLRGERRAQRYVALLFEVSVLFTIVPLVVHGLLAANAVPVV